MWIPIESLRLHVICFPEVMGTETVGSLVAAVKDGRAARDFNILVDYSAVERVDVDPASLVKLATSRRAALPPSGACVKSAAVAPGPAAREFIETWTTFFEEEDRAICTRIFDSLEPAADWLGLETGRDIVAAMLAKMQRARIKAGGAVRRVRQA